MTVYATMGLISDHEIPEHIVTPANISSEPGVSPLTILHGILADAMDDLAQPKLRAINSKR